MTTNLQRQTQATVQSVVRQERELGIGLLVNMTRAGEIIAPWWSVARDRQLVQFLLSSDHVQSAFWMIGAKIVDVPYRIIPRDRSVKRHQRLADQFQAILDNMIQFGQGWSDFWFRFLMDLWSTDNGAFGEVIGDGKPDGPLEGPAFGLSHLDSLRCTRTSNPEYPVIYQDVDGRRYKFHHSRVIYTSQEPSRRAEMLGVGHCWLSRCINSAQRLVDKDVYFQEMLGSRPLRQILIGRGISRDQLVFAIEQAEEGMDNRGLRRFSKTVFAGDPDRTDIGIDSVPFTLLPDGFDEDVMTRIAMAVISLAGGFPLRWVWPAGGVTGATKADALYQHIAGQGGGAQWHLNKVRDLLSYSDKALAIASVLPPKFLPKELKLVFDFQDDEQDRQQADIRSSRAETRKVDLETGVIDVRTAREQALDAGDITLAQFNKMELEDGRLPNGDDVLTLFDTTDPVLVELLDLGVDEPLLLDANDELDMILEIEAAALAVQERMVTAGSQTERENMRQALAALGKLKGLYEAIAGETIEQEMVAEQGAETQTAPTGAGEEAKEVKGFNYGVGAGKRIRGRLFRGRGGKFASEAEVGQLQNEFLRRLIDRLRGKRGEGGKGGAAKKPKTPKGGGGAAKPDKAQTARENRTKVFDALAQEFDIGRTDLDALAAFVNGGMPAREVLVRLAQFGLAEFDSFGNPRTTSAGKALFKAASDGKVQSAQEAVSRGREVVEKVRKRADDKRLKAAGLRQRADEMSDRIDDLNEDANALDEKADAEDDPEKATKLRERAAKKREQAEKARERQTQDRQRADEIDAEADDLDARVGGEAAMRLPAKPVAEETAAPAETGKPAEAEKPPAEKPSGPPAEKPAEPPRAAERTLARKPPVETPSPSKPPAEKPARQPTQDDFDTLNRVMTDVGSMTDEDKKRLVESGLAQIVSGKLKLTEAGVAAIKELNEPKKKSIVGFEIALTAAVTELWNGTVGVFTFIFVMQLILRRYLTEAWEKGAADCGIAPDEMTNDERSALSGFINGQIGWVAGFAADVAAHNQAAGHDLEPLLVRMQLWVLRYNEARERGKAMACADKKMVWTLGDAEHCQSCLKLSGKVKRSSFWHEHGILPAVAGASYLECHGYNCACTLVQINESVSRGPLPGLP